MNNLDKLLEGTGVKPAKDEKHLEDTILDAGEIMTEFFNALGDIFGNRFHEDRQKNYDNAKDKDDE